MRDIRVEIYRAGQRVKRALIEFRVCSSGLLMRSLFDCHGHLDVIKG